MKLLLLLGAVITVSLADEGTYSYSDQAAWGGVCSTGKHQSPIDIKEIKNTVYYDSEISSFQFPCSIELKKGSLKTTQFALTATPTFTNMPENWPVGHTKGLQALQLHLHWGRGDDMGSEHMLNGKQFVAELHLVTRNLDQDDETASDYYAVFGFFMEVVSEDSEDAVSGTLDDLLAGEKHQLELDELFFRNSGSVRSIYTYEGSLTTPGCDEKVFWQVMQEPIKVKQGLIDSMVKSGHIRDDKNNEFSFNYREIQELNGRHITHRLLHQAVSTADDSEETCKVDCHAAQQTCMWTMSGAATSLPSLALLFAALFYLM